MVTTEVIQSVRAQTRCAAPAACSSQAHGEVFCALLSTSHALRRACPQLLDENFNIIITILELQNQGKLQEVSQYAPGLYASAVAPPRLL